MQPTGYIHARRHRPPDDGQARWQDFDVVAVAFDRVEAAVEADDPDDSNEDNHD